ncbi:MAG: hypothetical protein OXC13_09240 [Caldilineaceae bacterium]|nr:hypothetical protein [Caldilineaceae bacterium]
MIVLQDDHLEFRFPEVHAKARCSISFMRTLRLPDDNRSYPLPPGLGDFPLRHVDDFGTTVPPAWKRHGGVFLPMYQAEAMWIDFNGSYPMALKIAAGKVCALTGEAWSSELVAEPQNYLVVPDQPWLDGFCIGQDLIRQFVAMPLGEGYSVEEQLTGEARHGGLQILAYPMKVDVYKARFEQPKLQRLYSPMAGVAYAPPEMGLAPGGLMRQEVYEDDYGLEAWDTSTSSRCFVHILNSVQYRTVTGNNPPSAPPSAVDYAEAGLPWFEYYASDLAALSGAASLAGLDSVAAKKIKKGEGELEANEPVQPEKIIKLQDGQVREGEF